MMPVVKFAATSLTSIIVLFLLLGVAFDGAAEREALQVAGVVAFVVQMAAFVVVRRMARRNVIAGWGVGVAIRFVAFALWGLVGVARLALPQSAALLAMATYLFVTTLFEPLFLKT